MRRHPDGLRRPSPPRHDRSLATVVLAGGANVVIALAKLLAGVTTGSSAMISEAAHSFADTLNQAFLLAALRGSRRPADRAHPFGYGMERYFWSLLGAVSVFVLGAGFSVLQGVRAFLQPTEQRHVVVALAVLGVAFVLDGASLVRALWQIRREPVPFDEVDPTVRAVALEDGAAVFGVLLAAVGLVLDAVLGTTLFDAVASLAIGLLLAGVAVVLGRQNQERLIGRALPLEVLREVEEEVAAIAGIDHVVELMSMRLGTDEVLLAARVAVNDELSGERLAQVADDVEERVQQRFPDIRHVFVDPTPD